MAKIAQVLFVLAAFVACAFAISTTWGTVGPKSQLLERTIYRNNSIRNGYVLTNYTYPRNGKPGKAVISAIVVTDLQPNGGSGFIKKSKGDVNDTIVGLDMKSLYEGRIDYDISVYGK